MLWHTLRFPGWMFCYLACKVFFFLCFSTWIWMVLVSCDLNGSCTSSLAKKVADTLPLERISSAAPCLVVLVVNVWQGGAHELIQSDYAIFTKLFEFTITSVCYAQLIWKTVTEAKFSCPAAMQPRESKIDILAFGISAVLMNSQLKFLSCRANKLRRPSKSEPFPMRNVRTVFMAWFESHVIATLATT